MNLKHNPIPFIFNQGEDIPKIACLRFFDLTHLSMAREFLSNLAKQQFSNGPFPRKFDQENWGMRETVRNALLLLQTGMSPDDKDLKSAIEFIIGHQNPDGGWCENPSVELPSYVIEMSNKKSVTWLTADVVELLRLADMEDREGCMKAIDWLRGKQNQHGGWYCFSGSTGEQGGGKGDPDSTAQITFLLGEIFGEQDPAFIKGKKLFETFLDESIKDVKRGYRIRPQDGKKERLDVYSLTHLLLSSLVDQPRRFQNGYDSNDPRVRKMMDALIKIQQPDGGWRPFWSEKSSPSYTVIAIKVLILSGVLGRENLIVDLRAYAGWRHLFQKLCKDEGGDLHV